MDRHRLALLTALAVLAVPAAAEASPVKIGPEPSSVSAKSATIEVANPNRYAVRGTATVLAGGTAAARRTVNAAQALGHRRHAALRRRRPPPQRRGGRPRDREALAQARLREEAHGEAHADAAPVRPHGRQLEPRPGRRDRRRLDRRHRRRRDRRLRQLDRRRLRRWAAAPSSPPRRTSGPAAWGTYDDLEFTLIDGQITITKTPPVPVYCFENGAGHYGNALSFEPFVVTGPWTLGADESAQQSGIAVNRLVSSGSRSITYKMTETAATATSVTGKLGMSFFDSKYDIFANQIWFVNCSGSQSFEAIPVQ